MSSLDYDRELLAIEKRKNEHVLIAMATQELFDDKKDVGSWGKALMESEGNIDLANSLYLKHRVQKLQDEISEDLLKKAKEQKLREDEARMRAAHEAEIEARKAAQKPPERGSKAYYDQQIMELLSRHQVNRESELMPILGIDCVLLKGTKTWSYNGQPSLRKALEKYIDLPV